MLVVPGEGRASVVEAGSTLRPPDRCSRSAGDAACTIASAGHRGAPATGTAGTVVNVSGLNWRCTVIVVAAGSCEESATWM